MCGHTDTKILDMCEHTDKKILEMCEHTDTKILDCVNTQKQKSLTFFGHIFRQIQYFGVCVFTHVHGGKDQYIYM